MIDPHVHLRDWAQKDKETVEHGLHAAGLAGITRVFDMPNTSTCLTSREAVLSRLALASPSVERHGVAYHVYPGLTSDPSQVEQMCRLHGELFPLAVGLKMFLAHSTGNMGLVTEAEQRSVMRTLADCSYEGVLALHAEAEEFNRPDLSDPLDFSTHSLARPAEGEIYAVDRIIRIARETGFRGHLHVCHISTRGAVELVQEAKGAGMRISCGATAHHALLSSRDASKRERYLKMNPPLRSAEDRDFIFSSLLDGRIDYVESDHAPHTVADKINGASGIPGFAGSLLLLDRLRRTGASESRLRDLFGGNVLRIFDLGNEDVFLPGDAAERFRMVDAEYPFHPFLWQ